MDLQDKNHVNPQNLVILSISSRKSTILFFFTAVFSQDSVLYLLRLSKSKLK